MSERKVRGKNGKCFIFQPQTIMSLSLVTLITTDKIIHSHLIIILGDVCDEDEGGAEPGPTPGCQADEDGRTRATIKDYAGSPPQVQH